MDTTAFFTELRSQFDGDPSTSDPRDPRFAALVTDVAGYTGPNELAVLHVAADLMPRDECYLEVGTFKGRSIVAAAAGKSDKHFVAMENFMEFGMAGRQAREELFANLERYDVADQVDLREGDCFTLMAEPGTVAAPVGVYFYDGEHTLLSHYLALAVVEPLLADEALVLVDDASWPVVQRAHRLFMRHHPGWSVQERWDAAHADDPRWSNGLHALVFRRPTQEATASRPARLSPLDESLRRYQTQVQDRLNSLAWRLVRVFPGPAKAAATLVMGRSRAIKGGERKG